MDAKKIYADTAVEKFNATLSLRNLTGVRPKRKIHR